MCSFCIHLELFDLFFELFVILLFSFFRLCMTSQFLLFVNIVQDDYSAYTLVRRYMHLIFKTIIAYAFFDCKILII